MHGTRYPKEIFVITPWKEYKKVYKGLQVPYSHFTRLRKKERKDCENFIDHCVYIF